MSAKNSEICRKIYAENILFVEGMQKDRHAPAFDVGNFLWKLMAPPIMFING